MEIGFCAPLRYDPRQAGADYLEARVSEFLVPDASDQEFARRLAARGSSSAPVPALNYLFLPEMKTVGPALDTAAVDAYMATVLNRAGSAGVKIIVYGSGPSRLVPDGFPADVARQQIVENLSRWAPLAAAAGVILVLEHLNRGECNIVNSLAEGAELVTEVGLPSVRLLADTYHMALEGESPDAIRRHGHLLAHAHTAEAAGRNPIGTAEDHRVYYRALKDIGYSGAMSLEPVWQDLERQAAPAAAALRAQISDA